MSTTDRQPRLGLRANLSQFCLLIAVNALIGGMVGQEQTVLPLLAEREFHLTGYTFLLTYVFAFGVTKAATNYFAGTWSDRFGRKPVLLAGWLLAIPVPLLLIWAPSWGWVVAANVLLGINQGLTWSTTVVMKIDLVGRRQRGLAMGFNEAAGYGAVALTAVLAGLLAAHYGLRPAPFLIGLSYALIGLGLTAVFVRETRGFAELEAKYHGAKHSGAGLTNREIFLRTSFTEPALSSASQAGLVNNLNFGLSWGLFPILFATTGMPIDRIGVLVAVYPAVWGVAQLATGALSDRWGRKHFITAGMLTQALGLALIATGDDFACWLAATGLLGGGTAMVYPTLLAAVGDVAHPLWRARAVGVYRLWRDTGYAAGAVVGGITADLWGLRAAIWAAAAITVASGLAVAVRMYETHPRAVQPDTDKV
ncbi:MFS transporter [Mycolicibacterium gadium]|uniref:MFS transporter n=1 Tax=Mycolicibacterium gadium TaxID=1794 RepID=A0ABT6GQ75_MYCGU|nr:MFS transporter [Mycolicibacterium gadium]MDG5483362.1 MFS transporter [Mycolicibacterium gadium]